MPERFQLSEVEGFLTPREGVYNKPFGLTVSVHDVAYLHRAVAIFRTEDYGGRGRSNYTMRQRARDAARAECARLNAKHPQGWPSR